MAEYQLQQMKEKHRAIAHYLVANPTVKGPELAAAFGISPVWLSIILNSDSFQDYLAELDSEFRHEVLLPLRTKLAGVADRAVERLGEKVESSTDPDFILAVADKTLHRLGYAPSRGPAAAAPSTVNIQQNYFADKETLHAARQRMLQNAQRERAPTELPTGTS